MGSSEGGPWHIMTQQLCPEGDALVYRDKKITNGSLSTPLKNQDDAREKATIASNDMMRIYYYGTFWARYVIE